MLRINLLPPYIHDAARRRQIIGAWVAGVIVVIALFGMKIAAISAELNKETERKNTADNLKTKYDALQGNIDKVKKDIAQTQEKQTFIANAKKFNDAWPSTFDMVRDVTSDQILLQSMAADPATRKTLTLNGFAADELRVIKWWMFLRNQVNKPGSNLDTVVFSGLPPHGYNPQSGAATGGGATFGSAMGARGAGGNSSMVAMMAGRPGGPAGGMRGGMPSSMMSGGMPPGMMGGRGGMQMAMMGGGARGGFGAAGGGGNETEIEGRRGLTFVATVTLKEPIGGDMPVPVWPAGAGATTGAPMGGGMPPGMMGSSMMMGGGGRPPAAGGGAGAVGGKRGAKGED